MNSWLVAALTLAIVGPVAWLLGALSRSKGDQVEIMTLTLERNDARSQRDRLNTENAALSAENAKYHESINRSQAMIGAAQVQALRDQKETEALKQENAALNLQLQEATKQSFDTRLEAPPSEPEQQYEVKKPSRATGRKATKKMLEDFRIEVQSQSAVSPSGPIETIE